MTEAHDFYLWVADVTHRRKKDGQIKEVWMSPATEELFRRGLMEHFPRVTNYRLPLDIVSKKAMAYKDVKVRMVHERWDVARRGK